MNDRPDPLGGPARPPVARWRLVLAVTPAGGDDARQARQAAWEQALRSCGLPVAGLDADPPRPRYAVAAPLSPSIAGEAELVDLWLTERLPRWRVREALEVAMPVDHRLVDVRDVWLGEPSLPGRVVGSVYRAELAADADAALLTAASAAMRAAPTLRRERAKGAGTVSYDLRPFIVDLEVTAGPALRMTLRHDPERGIGRPDEVLAELADRAGTPVVPRAIVRKALVLADPKPPAPPPQRRTGPRPLASHDRPDARR